MNIIRRTVIVAAVVLFGVACSGDKKKDAPPKKAAAGEACSATSDCQTGFVCLNDECSAATSGAILSNPGNAVTPIKVKKEIEDIGAKRQQKLDQQLDGVTP